MRLIEMIEQYITYRMLIWIFNPLIREYLIQLLQDTRYFLRTFEAISSHLVVVRIKYRNALITTPWGKAHTTLTSNIYMTIITAKSCKVITCTFMRVLPELD